MKQQAKNKPLVIAIAIAVMMLAAAALFAIEPWAAQAGRSSVSPKASLSEYSWGELSAIAQEGSSAGDEAAASRVAARYGLCADDGSPDVHAVREVTLADGTTFSVRLAGVYHDERTDGGRAGLSFVFAEPAGEHAMNHAENGAEDEPADSTGGWAASEMRVWLNGDFYLQLPADLRNAITPVQKHSVCRADTRAESDDAGQLAGSAADWADETSDKVWLLSATELAGAIAANETAGISESIAAAYGAEGEQYHLFADAGVRALAPNTALACRANGAPTTWWLRTKTLEFGDGFWLVGTDGTPLNGLGEDARVVEDPTFAPDELWGPNHPRSVIAGFCL